MPLTTTEQSIADLLVRYQSYGERQASEAAVFLMRGQASFGEMGETVPDTNVTHDGQVVDLGTLEEHLRANATPPSRGERSGA